MLTLTLETEVERQHASVSRLESPERALHSLSQKACLDLLLGLGGLFDDKPLHQLRIFAVADRGIEPDLSGIERLQRLDELRSQVRRPAELLSSGLPENLLRLRIG